MQIARSESWLARWWRRATVSVARALGQLSLGADYASGTPTQPSYDPASSMSAMAAFPWVYAALMRSSGDLAGLRLRVFQRRRGQTQELDSNHGLYRLLNQPHLHWTGRQLRRQLYVDLRLTGNSFVSRLGVGGASTLFRLHPRRVRIRSDEAQGYGDYCYNPSGTEQVIPRDQMFHVRAPSWQDDPRGLWGTGAIESLHHDLTTDRRAAQATSNLSRRPRPDILVSPLGEGEILTKEVRAEISKELDRLLGDGGTVVLPQGLKVDLPTWSPRDLEFPALRQLVREAILAVTGVPPHLVGLPVANYAQSQEQTLCYWELQQSMAADFEDAFFNPLAAQFGEGFFVHHDFSKVDALQNARTSRLGRVQVWWSMGFDPVKMAIYEGFEGLPEDAIRPVPVPTEDAGTKSGTPAHQKALPSTEEARATSWKSWVEQSHAPAERQLSGIMSLFFRQQAARLAARAAELEPSTLQKDLLDALLSLLWEEQGERLLLQTQVKMHLQGTFQHAWRQSTAALQLALAWQPEAADQASTQHAAQLAGQVTTTTRAALKELLRAALLEGDTPDQLQERLMRAAAFGSTRAFVIARTEATKALHLGTQAAYVQAASEGKSVKKQWLSARDGRESHQMLDGQVRSAEEAFVLPPGADLAGASAQGPGLFSSVSLCINCRCTTLPILEDS